MALPVELSPVLLAVCSTAEGMLAAAVERHVVGDIAHRLLIAQHARTGARGRRALISRLRNGCPLHPSSILESRRLRQQSV